MGLTVSPAAIAKVTSSQKIPPGLSSSDQQLLTQFFYDSAKAQLQQATIGAHLKDPSVTNADNVTSADITAATAVPHAFTAKQSVTVSPAIRELERPDGPGRQRLAVGTCVDRGEAVGAARAEQRAERHRTAPEPGLRLS